MMNLGIRPASLEQDQEQLVKILERNIPGNQDGHFEWRHQANPAGPGWSWVIYERGKDAIVAMASVFPRRAYLTGKPVLCGQVGEFVVDAPYRSLGPAVMLQRATFEPVNSRCLDFCYDCPPHDQGMSTFVRLGMAANTEVGRYAFPLRSDEFLGKRLGGGFWTKPLIYGTNVVLGMRPRKPGLAGLEISEFQGNFDEEFSRLDKKMSTSGMIRASRSAEDLNWRYRKNPSLKFRVLVARKAGELMGFLSYILFGERASIVDVFGERLPEVGVTLLEAVIDKCRRENLTCLEGYCSGASDLKFIFERIGFRLRERAARVVAYARPDDPLGGLLHSDVRWCFTQVEIML
jgi:hypothetical protein